MQKRPAVNLPHDEVIAIDLSGYGYAPTKVAIGEQLEYKRNGQRGAHLCEGLDMTAAKFKLVPIWHARSPHPIENPRAFWARRVLMRVLGKPLKGLTPDTIGLGKSVTGDRVLSPQLLRKALFDSVPHERDAHQPPARAVGSESASA